MIYNVLIKGLNPNVEEEVLIQLGNEELCCFVTHWASNISVGENHNVDIGITVLNDLDMQERKTITFYFQQIDESFAYYICGIFDFDARMINAGSIKIELDEDEVSLTDYAYLDGKSVIIRADRISARFID